MKQKKTRKKRFLRECHSIRAMRILYLRNWVTAVLKHVQLCMAKTYIHISQTSSYHWCNDSINGLFVPVPKGQRPTIMQTSSKVMLHGDIYTLNFTVPWAVIVQWIANNVKRR
jgi:hypothetical protein